MLGLVDYVKPNILSSLRGSMSELESLGLETLKLNELNDSYEVENLVENLKQMWFKVQIDACIQ